jgi:hypothetical protein
MDLSELTKFAESYAEAWCSQKPGCVASFFAETGSLKVNDGAPAVGREAIARVAQGFMRDFPDMQVTMDRVMHDAHGSVFHWTLTAPTRDRAERANACESPVTRSGSLNATD